MHSRIGIVLKKINRWKDTENRDHASYLPKINLIYIEITFVFGPVFLNEIEISIIEWFLQDLWVLVIEDTLSAKLIIFPLPFISYFLRLIDQSTISLHMPLYPLSLVFSSILKVKFSKSILQPVHLIPLISAPFRISFFYILSSFLRKWMPFLKRERFDVFSCFDVLN